MTTKRTINGPVHKHAHQSGDGITVAHCPFCGSGQVIGRSDGNIECSFCNAAFLVRVQPMFSAFPQTIDGMPVDIPGMPPAGGAAPGTMPPGAPGGEEAEQSGMGAEDTAPPVGQGGGQEPSGGESDKPSGGNDQDDDGGGDKPPPLGKKSYRTDSGVVHRPAYVDYLAALLPQEGAR